MPNTIDCKGLPCPKPVILTKKELESIDKGEVITIVDNDAARQNLQKLSESMGYTSKVQEKEGLYYVTITKNDCSTAVDMGGKELVILVSSDKLGEGAEKLGSALMKSYMFALSEADALPKSMLFINSGVRLTTEGSEVLESLQKLSDKGVEIMSCGTCLDFYDIKEKLLIGSISNMYTIVDKMNKASNTIKL